MTPGILLVTAHLTFLSVDVAAEAPPFVSVAMIAFRSARDAGLVLVALSTSEL